MCGLRLQQVWIFVYEALNDPRWIIYPENKPAGSLELAYITQAPATSTFPHLCHQPGRAQVPEGEGRALGKWDFKIGPRRRHIFDLCIFHENQTYSFFFPGCFRLFTAVPFLFACPALSVLCCCGHTSEVSALYVAAQPPSLVDIR